MTSSEIYEEIMHAAYERGIVEEVREKAAKLQQLYEWKDRTEILIEAYQFVKKKHKKQTT